MNEFSDRIRGLPPDKLEQLLRAAQSAREAGSISDIPAWDPRVPAPLSFAQQRLWFLEQLGDLQGAYHIPVVIQLDGPLNAPLLERSVRDVAHRHEILRTGFNLQGLEPVQVIAAEADFEWQSIDCRGLPPDEQQTALRERLQSQLSRKFCLESGSLLRFCLLQLQEQRHLLLLTLHHLLADGWSLGILIRDLAAIYSASLRGTPLDLPPLPRQYAGYCVWQRQQWDSGRWSGQLEYWRRKLSGLSQVPMRTDRPRPAVQTLRGATEALLLPVSLSRELQRAAQSEGSTLFQRLLAAFQIVLSGYSGQTDIAVGVPVTGRGRRVLEDLIGCFVNTLVYRGNLPDDLTFRELLNQTRDTAWEALAHQDVPFEKVVSHLAPQRDVSHAPLVQVLFGVHSLPAVVPDMADLKLSFPEVHISTARFDLEVNVFDTPAGLRAISTCNADLYHPGTVRSMLQHFHAILERTITRTDCRLSELRFPQQAEQQAATQTWQWTTAQGKAPPSESATHSQRENYEF